MLDKEPERTIARQITLTAQSLGRELAGIIGAATAERGQLLRGHRVSDNMFGQMTRSADRASAALTTLLAVAAASDLTDEEILAAYTAKDW